MIFLNRLKPYFLLIALAFGLLMIEVLSPLDFTDGVVLLIYGASIGAWHEQYNPSVVAQDEGPNLPWSAMHAGDKLEYFLPAMSLIAFGITICGISAFMSGGIAGTLVGIGAGLLVTAYGLGLWYSNWIHRFGAVESE